MLSSCTFGGASCPVYSYADFKTFHILPSEEKGVQVHGLLVGKRSSPPLEAICRYDHWSRTFKLQPASTRRILHITRSARAAYMIFWRGTTPLLSSHWLEVEALMFEAIVTTVVNAVELV